MAPSKQAFAAVALIAATWTLLIAEASHVAPNDAVFGHVHPESLVALYNLDGTTIDRAETVSSVWGGVQQPSVHTADAAVTEGVVVFNRGVGDAGRSAYFDGASRIDTPHNINPSTMPGMTFGAWIKPASINWASSATAYDRER